MLSLKELTSRHASDGKLDWIGIRPARKESLIPVETVRVRFSGLEGDHRTVPGKRAVTLLQSEHLDVIAALSRHALHNPQILRRNLAVSGINLLALRDRQFQIGSVIFEGTGICAPCSRMEEALGNGGYNAMRGHGGITAQVVQEGNISVGDRVTPVN